VKLFVIVILQISSTSHLDMLQDEEYPVIADSCCVSFRYVLNNFANKNSFRNHELVSVSFGPPTNTPDSIYQPINAFFKAICIFDELRENWFYLIFIVLKKYLFNYF